jgi:4'-phosphopantetheinyl transferase
MNLKNTLKYLNENPLLLNESMNENELLRIWTLKEAYCKFLNKNMPSIFNEELKLESVCYSSYVLNDEHILSIVTNTDFYSLNIGFLPKIACFENSED